MYVDAYFKNTKYYVIDIKLILDIKLDYRFFF